MKLKQSQVLNEMYIGFEKQMLIKPLNEIRKDGLLLAFGVSFMLSQVASFMLENSSEDFDLIKPRRSKP